jgi:hypothetical protein
MASRRSAQRLIAPSATHEEAAAIVAALERFARDFAAPAAAVPERPDPWLLAARREAVAREDTMSWINT